MFSQLGQRFYRLMELAVQNVVRGENERHFAELREAHQRALEATRFESGLLREQLNRIHPPSTPEDAGYRVYSQFDEDGILQSLIRACGPMPATFIEIGVDDYRESNTRYLLEKDRWSGLVVDCGPQAETFLHQSGLFGWRTIEFRERFVEPENVNDVVSDFEGEIGVLSIDIDGMDYYVWEALTAVNPVIVIIEYNAYFGPERRLTVPRQAKFDRYQHHFSGLCFGASISALAELGAHKGYALVAGSSGPNAFFVRHERVGALKVRKPEEAYEEPRHRESRDRDFKSSYVTGLSAQREAIADARVVDLDDHAQVKSVRDALL